LIVGLRRGGAVDHGDDRSRNRFGGSIHTHTADQSALLREECGWKQRQRAERGPGKAFDHVFLEGGTCGECGTSSRAVQRRNQREVGSLIYRSGRGTVKQLG